MTHNAGAQWLREVESDFAGLEKQAPISVSVEDVIYQVKGLPNWKAPGPDSIQGFWIKKLVLYTRGWQNTLMLV